jgi:hypothetical protein
MSTFPQGGWQIEGVLINGETVLNDEGYRFIELVDNTLTILPVEMRFVVKQSQRSSAVLESQGQTFFAEIEQADGSLTIEISRPKYKDRIRIEATVVSSPVAEFSKPY